MFVELEPPWTGSALQLVGRAARQSRHRLGWTQRELAARVRLSQSTISRIEHGRNRTLKLSKFARLMVVLEWVGTPESRALAVEARDPIRPEYAEHRLAQEVGPRGHDDLEARFREWMRQAESYRGPPTHRAANGIEKAGAPQAAERRRVPNRAANGIGCRQRLAGRRGRLPQSPSYRATMMAALWPPRPMLFESAARTRISTASVGTHRSQSGSASR